MVPESQDLETNNRTYHEAQSRMELLPNYYRWIYGKFSHLLNGVVVELGCGAGLGISTYLHVVDHLYAVDYNPTLLDRIRVRFQSDKITVIQTDLTGDWDALVGLKADVVLMMDLLEHFEDDAQLLKRATGLAKQDGLIIVKVPAQKRLYSAMDKASGHFRRYDREDLERLASLVGLRLVQLRRINPIGALVYRFRRSQMTNFSRSFETRQLRLINALLPALRLCDAIPGLQGLSHIAILRTPG